jgi:Kef-type K+ transport system membrane component KefB
MRRRIWLYPVLVGLFVALIAVIFQFAAPRLNPADLPSAAAAGAQSPWDAWRTNATQPLARLILQVVVVLAAARTFGAVLHRFGQPPVIGEMVAGIALGPSLLGLVAPGVFAAVFPPTSLGALQLLSQIGVVLFMFVVGLELNWSDVRKQAHAVVIVSHVSIVFPFLLGVIAALYLYQDHAPAGVSFQAFGLFMGIAMSITAFPVLARIVEERRMSKTPIGSIALTCAAVDDVTAWTLLALVVAIVTAGGAGALLAATVGSAGAFVLFMVVLVRPALASWLRRKDGEDTFGRDSLTVVIAVLFGSSLFMEIVGLHALFGAFLAGVVMPRDPAFSKGLRDRMDSVGTLFLLPLFFAFTGLRTRVDLLTDGSAWMVCAGIIALATIGKLGGSTVTARLTGLDWNSAFTLGALMNTRGLMELVALNIGYDLGVISPEMFAILVLMAVFTTVMTGPLVDLARQRSAVSSHRSAVTGQQSPVSSQHVERRT